MELLQPDHFYEENLHIQHSPIVISSSSSPSAHSSEYLCESPRDIPSEEIQNDTADLCITPHFDRVHLHSSSSHAQTHETELSHDLTVVVDEHPFKSPSLEERSDQGSDRTYSPSQGACSSQISIEQRDEVKQVGEDGLSTEERYERLSTLLERSTLFTEVVGGQVRKQQEKRRRKKEAEQKSRSLKSIILTNVSSQQDNILSQESVEEAVEGVRYKREEHVPVTGKRSLESQQDEQNPKRFKSVNVRYYKEEVIPSEQPNLLTGAVLRNYQVDGYDWLRILYENGINGILADEMGLGKTIQAIALICYLVERGIKGPFLVVAPLSTLYNWLNEFARFAPSIYTLLYQGKKSSRRSALSEIKSTRHNNPKLRGKSNKRPVVVTHYEMIRYDFKKLLPIKWSYMILDEGHKIKNWTTRVNRCLNVFKCESRLILTGTPIQNNLTELWSLLNFLMPVIFNDKNTFQHWFDVRGNLRDEVIYRERHKPIIGMIQKIIRPFIMRRMKGDVSLNLPPKKEILVYCPLTRVQKNFYKALLNRTIMSMVRDEYGIKHALEEEKEGDKVVRSTRSIVNYKEMSDKKFMKVVNGYEVVPLSWNRETVKREAPDLLPVHIEVSAQMVSIHMRKVVNHPYLIAHPYDQFKTGRALIISEDMVQISGKMSILDQMLKNLIPKGHKMLIYSQWVRILDLIQDLMELRDIEFVRLQGSHELSTRESAIHQFQTDSKVKCFLITTRAGGLGINLTAADTVIIFDSDWNPHVDQQAQDRCHRIGQTLPVIVYRLVAAHTIDQKLVELAFKKKKLDKILINNKDFCKNSWTQNKINPVRIEDLQELLTELEYDKQIGEGNEFTKEQMITLLDRANLIEGVSNKVFRVISDKPQNNEEFVSDQLQSIEEFVTDRLQSNEDFIVVSDELQNNEEFVSDQPQSNEEFVSNQLQSNEKFVSDELQSNEDFIVVSDELQSNEEEIVVSDEP